MRSLCNVSRTIYLIIIDKISREENILRVIEIFLSFSRKMFNIIKLLSSVIILFGFLHMTSYSREEHLWCYECNTDLSHGHKGDCNDPYTPSAFDLIACPRNESHHCHKSIILYRNILVTVRACVLSRQVNKYCDYKDSFPHSDIKCYFCNENACNGKGLFNPISKWNLGFVAIISSWVLT